MSIDEFDMDGFNDFRAGDVFFDHRPERGFWKVYWIDGGCGRMKQDETGWHGFGNDLCDSFGPVTTKAEAVRRLVAKEWDP